MSAFNRVMVDWECPRCDAQVERAYQFKYGDVQQHNYRLGDRLWWGGNDEGTPGISSVIVDCVPEPCPRCGWDEDSDYDLLIGADILMAVTGPRTGDSVVRAEVYSRGTDIIVCSYSKTLPGFWVMNGSFIRLSDHAEDARLGTAVLDGLAASTQGIGPPDPKGPSPFAPVLKVLGIRSFSQFAAGACAVNIERRGTGITVTPTVNGGSQRGFVPQPGMAIPAVAESPSRLGAAVRSALARST